MAYNSNIHHRRSIRLKGYDYSRAGLYFITICCDERLCRFGKIETGKMILNEYGMIAYNEWSKLPERFPNFELDVFQIMPNHIHGIIMMTDVGATLAVAQNEFTPTEKGQPQGIAPTIAPTVSPTISPIENGQPQGIAPTIAATISPTVPDIVGAYKSLVFNGCLKIYKSKNEMMGKLWQRNYYEHIIRNEQAYQNISAYIINNPVKWTEDKFHQ